MSPLRKVRKRKDATKTLRLEVSQSVINEKINLRADFVTLSLCGKNGISRSGLNY